MGDYWGVVIGINQYWRPEACLKGARADALRMCEWLLQEEAQGGGGVPPRQLFVILEEDPAGPPLSLPRGVNIVLRTTKSMINSVLERLYQKSQGKGDRLYFYFSGHGLTALENGAGQGTITAGDFEWANTENSLSLHSILEYFKSMEFLDQFFFVDACRNLLREGNLNVGRAPRPVDRLATLPPAQQFPLFATSPGVKAAEIALEGKEAGGAFTDALLRGLAGGGLAKAFDYRTGRYLVRWGGLVRFVLEDVTARKLTFKEEGRADEARLIQVPQEAQGGRGSTDAQGRPRETDPVLARHAPNPSWQEELEILLDPEGTRASANVSVYAPPRFRTPVATRTRIQGLPVVFKLPPRDYNIGAEVPGYEPLETEMWVELYKKQRVTLRWKAPAEPEGAAAASNGAAGQPAAERVPAGVSDAVAGHDVADDGDAADDTPIAGSLFKGLGLRSRDELLAGAAEAIRGQVLGSRGEGLGPPEDSGEPGDLGPLPRLVVDPGDSLALVDVLEMSGDLIESRHGKIDLPLPPGAYKVRLRTPEGLTEERIVGLKPREPVEPIRPVAPARGDTPFMTTVRSTAGFSVDDRNMLHVSERVGAMAAGELSTVLALAGTLATYPPGLDPGWGHRLRTLGLLGPSGLTAAQQHSGGQTPDTPGSGIYVVFGDEVGPDQATSGLPAADLGHVRLHLSRVGGAPDAKEYYPAKVARPSDAAGGLAEFFAPRAPGLYWFMVEAPGRAPALFSVMLLPDRLTLIVFHRRINDDVHVFQYFPRLIPEPNGGDFDPQELRSLELFQRYYLRGQYADIGDPERLLGVKWGSPLGTFLAGYLLLRAGRVTDAERVAAELVDQFPRASDSHLLVAECHDALGRAGPAEAAYRATLDLGLPTFAEGLARLWVKIGRRKIDHRMVRVVNDACACRVPGLIWTAFTPPALPG
ncbi:MAG: caspase family protein [Gemmataceae bacterium]|nr:caspase family protein [Gemmataceae bacterium]